MIVYVLMEDDYDNSYLLNVYTDKEKAELDRDQFQQECSDRGSYFHIQEKVVVE